MYKNLRWKLIVIAAVTALGVWSFVPPAEKIRLGLDLKGGMHLVLSVKTDDALKIETDTSVEQLKAALKDKNITVNGRVDSLTQFTIDGVAPGDDQQFRTLADSFVGLSFDRDQASAGVYTFRMK